MHSINHNSELSNFSNYLKKDIGNSLGFNDFQFFSQNSASLALTPFNHQYSQLDNPLQKIEPEVKLEENVDPRDQTIGFNQLHGILENSINFSIEQFKNAKLKKPTTFQHTQGYLNAPNDHTDLCKQEASKTSLTKKDHHNQSKDEQILRNSGDINNAFNSVNQNQKNESLVKAPHDALQYSQKPKKRQSRRAPAHDDDQLPHENCLQNLKCIAKVAFEEIKKSKCISNQDIATALFDEISREVNGLEPSHLSKLQHESVSSQGKSSKKSQLISDMIRNKSFSGIKHMAEIEEDSLDTRTKKIMPKFEEIEGESHEYTYGKEHPAKNIKNIRRRLYDAINVMIAANVIERRGNAGVALKVNYQKQQQSATSSNNSTTTSKKSQPPKGTPTKAENPLSYQQLQLQIQQKRMSIEAKRKYRQMLGTKYLVLQKHVTKNRTLHNRPSHSQQKLSFPLVFASVQTPSKINIQEDGSVVEIESVTTIDLNCELDLLGLLYWIEKEEVVRKEEELMVTRVERERFERDDGEGEEEMDNEEIEGRNGRKRVKVEEGEDVGVKKEEEGCY